MANHAGTSPRDRQSRVHYYKRQKQRQETRASAPRPRFDSPENGKRKPPANSTTTYTSIPTATCTRTPTFTTSTTIYPRQKKTAAATTQQSGSPARENRLFASHTASPDRTKTDHPPRPLGVLTHRTSPPQPPTELTSRPKTSHPPPLSGTPTHNTSIPQPPTGTTSRLRHRCIIEMGGGR